VLTRRLGWWSGASILAGLGLLPLGSFWRGFGLQALSWGAADAAIAAIGRRSMANRQAELADPSDPASMRPETLKLRRLLWLNTLLDILYIAGGLGLNATRGRNEPAWRGHGWGIILQGAFLFLFDLYHVLVLPNVTPVANDGGSETRDVQPR